MRTATLGLRNMGAAGVLLLLVGCAARQSPPMPTERPGLLTRELSESEKKALAHALSRTLKDPDSAQFQWDPVRYLPGTQTTEYCSLINAKNSYGGYTGYETFHALLQADAKGQYTSGQIERIMAANPIGDEQLAKNVEGYGLCIQAGYGKRSTVPQ